MTKTFPGHAEYYTPPAADAAFARWLAAQASELLLDLRADGYLRPDALRAAGDARSHELIASELARWRPADAVLSEEAVDDPARLDAERVWIVDPLDGTREVGEPERVDWGVHIALWQRGDGGGRLSAGGVARPASGGGGARPPARRSPPLSRQAASGGPPRLVASRTRPPEFLFALAADLGAELVPMGSVGAKITAVVDGTVDGYVHAGGQ